jgi:hypothetical protein
MIAPMMFPTTADSFCWTGLRSDPTPTSAVRSPAGVAPERRRAAPRGGSLRTKDRRRPTLPGPRGPSTIGAERLNGSVRNGKRCFPLAIATETRRDRASERLENCTSARNSRAKRKTTSSPRPISTGQLSGLPRLYRRPINLVVYQGSYSLKGMGELISRSASRLDAFSGYPIHT